MWRAKIIFILFLLEKWESHADVETVRWIQARNQVTDDCDTPTTYISSSEYEEETYDDEQGRKKAERGVVNNSTGSSSEENDIPPVANKFEVLSTE